MIAKVHCLCPSVIEGLAITGIGRITRLRNKLGLRCTQVHRFTPTTDTMHALLVEENLLAQTVAATRPNETRMTNITYVPTTEGWLYLADIRWSSRMLIRYLNQTYLV